MVVYRYNVGLVWSGEGSPGVNVWHIRSTGPFEPAGPVQDCIDAIGAFYDDISSMFPTSMVITGPDEIVAGIDSSPTFEPVTGFEVTGDSGTGNILPAATALVVGWRTNSATRSGRGRTFLGPVAGTLNEADGTPTSGLLSTVRDAASDLVTASVGVSGAHICVWSPTTSQTHDFTNSQVRDIFAVLRSRRD